MTALQSKPKVKHHSSEKKSSEKSEVKDKSIDKDKGPDVKDKLKTPSDKQASLKKKHTSYIQSLFIYPFEKKNYLNFRGEKEKSKDHKMSTGLKRKHHGEKKEERRGRPRKIDKERSLMSTPVTHVHVCTKKLCKCLVWRRFFLINLYVKMVLYITLCINFYSKEKEDKSIQPTIQNILCTCMYNLSIPVYNLAIKDPRYMSIKV